MAFSKTDALVLREVRYKEADRILTLFTPDRGIMTAKARGALRKNSKTAAATQQLTLSEMTLFENKGYATVNEAVVKEPFDGLRKNFENFALGCYFSECAEALIQEGESDVLSFQLILNSLYALSHELADPLLIKAAFELRLMCLMGYTPDVSSCFVCGKEKPVSPMLGIETGHLCCRACRNSAAGKTAALDDASLSAVRYIVSAPAKQLFSFRVEGESLKNLSNAAESYLLQQAGRKFSTLDYWKQVAP